MFVLIEHGLQRVLGVLEVITVFLAVELVLPARKRFPVAARLKGIGFLLAQALMLAFVVDPLNMLWLKLGVRPLVELPIDKWFAWAGPASIVASGLVAAIIVDFFGYWFHRIQHGPLWRFHAVHHSIEELHGVNSFTHILDPVFQLALMTIPMSLIHVSHANDPYILTLIFVIQPYYIHSQMKFELGPFRRMITDNRYHRIHHSTDPIHFDKNFGVITTIWDQLFGTAYFPKRGEWPASGLADVPEPRTFRDWLVTPFRPAASPATQEA